MNIMALEMVFQLLLLFISSLKLFSTPGIRKNMLHVYLMT